MMGFGHMPPGQRKNWVTTIPPLAAACAITVPSVLPWRIGRKSVTKFANLSRGPTSMPHMQSHGSYASASESMSSPTLISEALRMMIIRPHVSRHAPLQTSPWKLNTVRFARSRKEVDVSWVTAFDGFDTAAATVVMISLRCCSRCRHPCRRAEAVDHALDVSLRDLVHHVEIIYARSRRPAELTASFTPALMKNACVLAAQIVAGSGRCGVAPVLRSWFRTAALARQNVPDGGVASGRQTEEPEERGGESMLMKRVTFAARRHVRFHDSAFVIFVTTTALAHTNLHLAAARKRLVRGSR